MRDVLAVKVSEFGLSRDVFKVAVKIWESFEESGGVVKNHDSFFSGLVYVACKVVGHIVTQRELGYFFGVSEPTVGKFSRLLQPFAESVEWVSV